MGRAGVCAALATCAMVAVSGLAVEGCFKLGPTELDGNLLGDACWLFCGGLSLGGGCAHGTASCGADASACETPTLSDDANCGGCGVHCPQGRTCKDGSCYLVETLTSDEVGEAFPDALAVGGAFAYVTLTYVTPGSSGPGLVAIPTSGGSPRALTMDSVGGMWADAQGVYFVDTKPTSAVSLEALGPADASPRTLLVDASSVDGIFGTDSQSVFYTLDESQPGSATSSLSIAQVPKSGGPQVVLTHLKNPPTRPFAAVAGSSVYFLDGGNLFQEEIGAGVVTQLSTDGAATWIAAGANTIYTLTAAGAVRYDLASRTHAAIWSRPLPVTGITADDGALYLAIGDAVLGDDQIVRIDANGNLTVLAGAQFGAESVAVDDAYVYWWALDIPDDADSIRVLPRRVSKLP